MKEKSNRVYKLAAVLMVLCLITACVIGTTLAKYTTSGSGTDSAQVAKWGVKVTITGADTTFAKEYSGTAGTTVKSTTSKVVAPGTSSPNALTFSISGTPEVSAKVEFAFSGTDVFLAAEEHTDPIEEKTVNIDADYHPVKFTLTKTGETDPLVDGGTLADVKTAIENLGKTTIEGTTTPTVYAPNTNLGATIGTYQLSWAWAFDGNDEADTLLGNYIASSTPNSDGHWSTSISYSLTITVTQVD